MSAEYEQARQDLRRAERDLMLQRERVAQMRRSLPLGPIATDVEFGSLDGPVRLTELVGDAGRSLVVYHFMFGGRQSEPCPMCSMWADGWNAVADHLATRLDLVLVTQASVAENSALVAAHGWESLRWLSAADTSFKSDYGSVDTEGNQSPFFTVFERDPKADQVRLSWSGAARIDDEHWRGVDLLSPVWHFFDLTRQGRGEWMPTIATSPPASLQ